MNKKTFENELAKIIETSKEFGTKKVLLFGSCLEDREFFRYYGKISMAIKEEVDLGSWVIGLLRFWVFALYTKHEKLKMI
ncbi:MAG: hypothetical protein AB1765_01350 [Candidatus Hydrogenedentota bacterium]